MDHVRSVHNVVNVNGKRTRIGQIVDAKGHRIQLRKSALNGFTSGKSAGPVIAAVAGVKSEGLPVGAGIDDLAAGWRRAKASYASRTGRIEEKVVSRGGRSRRADGAGQAGVCFQTERDANLRIGPAAHYGPLRIIAAFHAVGPGLSRGDKTAFYQRRRGHHVHTGNYPVGKMTRQHAVGIDIYIGCRSADSWDGDICLAGVERPVNGVQFRQTLQAGVSSIG